MPLYQRLDIICGLPTLPVERPRWALVDIGAEFHSGQLGPLWRRHPKDSPEDTEDAAVLNRSLHRLPFAEIGESIRMPFQSLIGSTEIGIVKEGISPRQQEELGRQIGDCNIDHLLQACLEFRGRELKGPRHVPSFPYR